MAVGIVMIVLSIAARVISVRPTTERRKYWFILIGSIAGFGLIIALEGAFFAFSPDRNNLTGMTNRAPYTVAVFCASLFFTGMAVFISSLMTTERFSITKALAYGGGIAVAAEGLVIVGVAERTLIHSIGWVMGSTIQLLGIQLLLLGLAFVVLTLIVDEMERMGKLGRMLRYLCAVMIAVEGIGLASLATSIDISGIGNILGRTVVIAGVQLAVLGIFILALSGLSTNPQNRRMRKLAFLSALFLALLVPMAILSAGKIL